MEQLTIAPEVLRWAADQAGETVEELAAAIAKRPRDRERLVAGRLTTAQVERVSERTGVPFGLLLLDEPPQLERPTIPDLRQTIEAAPLGSDFYDVLEDALRKQQWYANYMREQGAEPLPFVGSFPYDTKPKAETVAQALTGRLSLSPSLRRKATNAEEYFTLISERAEDAGVLVMKSGIVKSNTRRPLSVHEFRGFAVVDSIAPLVFVNGRDADVASVFTLVHELAHIWIGQSGVSDLSAEQRGVERLSNRIAAEVLTPRSEFLRAWDEVRDVERLARQFRVSRLVIARRALDLGKLDQAGYDEEANRVTAPRRKESGGSAYRTIPIRNSRRFTSLLVRTAMTGETLLREAASLLSVRPETVVELARRLAR